MIWGANIFVLPSLNDGRIVGIMDGEGSFTISILSKSPVLLSELDNILTQKWKSNKCILEYIVKLFTKKEGINIGSVVPHSVYDVWEYRINELNNCKEIIPYFDKYDLKTKKK